MRDVAIVSFSQAPNVRCEWDKNEVELLAPVMRDVRDKIGLAKEDVDFVCSGSSDYLAGQPFSFVMALDAFGAWPPISESHVEMDGAFALYEAWVKLQIGEIDTALVELHATGLKVMYTELDVNLLPSAGRGADPAVANPYADGLPDEQQRQLAKRYAEIFGLILEHRNRVSRVTFWGLSDADSWLNRGRMNHPLLWDRQRQPKPAFHAVVDVLKRGR